MKNQDKNVILEKIRKMGEKLKKTFDKSLTEELKKERLYETHDPLAQILNDTKEINKKYFKPMIQSLEKKKFLIEYQKQLTQLAALITYFSKKEYSQLEEKNQISDILISKINNVLKDQKSEEFYPTLKDYESIVSTVKELKLVLAIPEKGDTKEISTARKEYLNELTLQIYENVAETAKKMDITKNNSEKKKLK